MKATQKERARRAWLRAWFDLCAVEANPKAPTQALGRAREALREAQTHRLMVGA